MKKIIAFVSVLMLGMSVYAADENAFQQSVNMTPRNSFSGYTNNSTRNIYPKLNTTSLDKRRQDLMKPRSVHDVSTSSEMRTNMPMQPENLPNNYDSSNMLHTPGLQNLQNVNMYF